MRLPVPRRRSRRIPWLIGASLLVVVVAAPVVGEASETGRSGAGGSRHREGGAPSLRPARAVSVSGASCGPQGAAMIAGVDSMIAQRIYAGEVAGLETRVDVGHVVQSRALLSAMASLGRGQADSPAAIYAAVHAIVYAPHWHIVRLRVLKAGRVIADVGGPYVTAPVSGVLERHGRTVGSYVVSVQDDVGFVKLVSRFIGIPVDLYRGHQFLMGTLRPAPRLAAREAGVVAGGRAYQERVFAAAAFPAGQLNVALFAPTPASVLASSCQALLADTWGSAAMHIAARFKPLPRHYHDLVGVVKAATGASAFVLSGGREIAGGRLPAHTPTSGTVRIGGRARAVFSWSPSPQVRVYVIAPA